MIGTVKENNVGKYNKRIVERVVAMLDKTEERGVWFTVQVQDCDKHKKKIIYPNCAFIIIKDSGICIFLTTHMKGNLPKQVCSCHNKEALDALHGGYIVLRWGKTKKSKKRKKDNPQVQPNNSAVQRKKKKTKASVTELMAFMTPIKDLIKPVTTVATHPPPPPQEQKAYTLATFPVPAACAAYNYHMNAVDRFDQLRASIATLQQEKTLPTSMLTFIIDACILNAHALAKAVQPDTTPNTYQFKFDLAKQLLNFSNKARKIPRNPTIPIQLLNGRQQTEAYMDHDAIYKAAGSFNTPHQILPTKEKSSGI